MFLEGTLMPILSVHKSATRWLLLLALNLSMLIAITLPAQVTRAQDADATKTDELSDDQNGNNEANPGDTLRYTIIITNTSGVTLTTVVVSDTVDRNTSVVPGSLRITPVGINDSYAAIGNTQMSIAAPGVL